MDIGFKRSGSVLSKDVKRACKRVFLPLCSALSGLLDVLIPSSDLCKCDIMNHLWDLSLTSGRIDFIPLYLLESLPIAADVFAFFSGVIVVVLRLLIWQWSCFDPILSILIHLVKGIDEHICLLFKMTLWNHRMLFATSFNYLL